MLKKRVKTKAEKRHPKGMGLVEVIVAIAISVVTLTSSVVFSTRLEMRSQQSFVDESILQLQNLITEQLRLVEQGLKRDVKNNLTFATAAFLEPDSTGTTFMTWRQFCSDTLSYNNFSMVLPTFSGLTHTIRLSSVTGTGEKIPDDDVNLYVFSTVSGNESFGSFEKLPVQIGLRKSFVDSSSGLGKNIVIKTVVKYSLYNKTYYTKPQEVSMIRSLVCAAG
jgi:hypothetical protein